MSTHVKTSADEKFAADLKKAKLARTEMNLAQKKRLDHTTKLRALRLVKEEADREIEIQNKANKKTEKPGALRAKPASSSQTAARTGK